MKNVKIIAELGSVHDGSFGNCLKLIELAKKNGADIVKLQHHISDEETLKDAPNPKYFKSENRYDYFNRTSFSEQQWSKIINFAKQIKIEFMCSVFSIASFNLLKKLKVKNIKIPSGEVTNFPLLEKISKVKEINVFLSTGMSNWKEINNAVKIFSKNKLCIMQCTSMYPCPPEFSGINIVEELFKKYGKTCDIGFSDHTYGNVAAILAFNHGATFFEKHLTFSRDMYGSDAKFACIPEQFKSYCENLRTAEKIKKSKFNKNNIKLFKNMRSVFQKSIYYKKDLKRGHKLKIEDLSFKKPDNGISASKYKLILEKVLKKNVKKDMLANIRHF